MDQVKNAKLKALLDKNRDLLSFDVGTIAKKGFSSKDAKTETRLADVPDDVWKHQPVRGKYPKKGGRDTSDNVGPEHPNHFADVDVPYKNSTLGALCVAQPDTYLTPAAWKAYYAYRHTYYPNKGDSEGAKSAATASRQGILPFRIWQIVDEMIGFARAKDYKEFVCAAGIAAHYVGDASQPLHASYLADGDRSRPLDRQFKDRDGKMKQDLLRSRLAQCLRD